MPQPRQIRLLLCAGLSCFSFSMMNAQEVTLNHISRLNTEVTLASVGSPIIGESEEVKVTVVDFKAFDCPPCKALESKHSGKVRDYFKDDNRVRFVYKIGRIQSSKAPSVRHAYCANKLDMFWSKGKTALFASPGSSASQIATAMGLDADQTKQFTECAAAAESLDYLNQELKGIKDVGLQYFPTVFIGLNQFSVDANDIGAADKMIAEIKKQLGE